jgi:signal transduction histidine kinase/CheY-like chemotaxis protein
LNIRHRPFRGRAIACLLTVLVLFFCAGTPVFAADAGSDSSASHSAAGSSRNVLFLSSYSPDWYEVSMQMQGLQNALERSVSLQYVFMDTKHIGQEEAEAYTYTHLETLCSKNHFDAAVVGDDAALHFAMKYHAEFFADLPIVFMGINSVEAAQAAAALPLVTGTIEALPLEQTLALAASLRPDATRVLSITDGTTSGNAVLSQLREAQHSFPQFSFEVLDSSLLTRDEIVSQLSACGDDTILLYLVMARDGEGNSYNAKQAAEFLSGAADVPIFRADEMGIGNGFFGGCVISYLQMGEQAGETVKEVLNGTAPDTITVQPMDTRYEFDYEQLRRFDIAESALPDGSQIINRPKTYWSENRQTLIPAFLIIFILAFMLLMVHFNSRKRIVLQKKLLESQKLYKTAANSADLVIWEYDPSTHRITMSFDSVFTKRVCEVRGFPQVLENGPDRQAAVIYEEDRPALLEMYRQIDAGAETAECKYGFLWEGAPCYRWARATAVYDEKTRRRTAVCLSSDITTERRMQELYEKELQYLHQSNDGALTSKGHIDLTNGTVLEYKVLVEAGIRQSDMHDYDALLKNFLSTLESEKDQKTIAALADRKALMKKFREGERHLNYRYRRAKQGQPPAWINLQCNMFLAPANGHIECFMYSYDVTEQELKNQIIAKLIYFGYENIGFVYPDTHAATSFLLNEPGARQKVVSTLDYDGMLRHVLSKSQPAEPPEILFTALRMTTVTEKLRTEAVYLYPFTIRNAAQRMVRKQFVFSWVDENRDTIFFCLSDITAQYETAQKQIQELSAARLAAVKANEAKSSFLSSMSHDLRTPLNGIIGFTEIALKESDPARKQEYLEKIKLSGDLLLSLVNDTLDLSRIESGKIRLEPEDTDSRSFLQSVLAAVKPVAEQKGVHLVADVAQYPCEMIYVDRLKLQKVILNLLSNAVKYTLPGGTVRFAAENIASADSPMTRRITVADNGIGMRPEFLEHLYEPFAQEMRPEAANVQGTGLGLSIVKKIVDLMGGTIEVRSEVNVGTTFVVDLPISCKRTAVEQKAIAECAVKDLSGKHILLVEDNYLNAEIATLLLKEKGIAVTLAENGELGAERFAASAPGTFDAVLMDIRMPVMSGYEAARAIRGMDRTDAHTVPIIAMTADAFEEDLRLAKSAGMNDFVTKPVDPQNLYRILYKAIHNG